MISYNFSIVLAKFGDIVRPVQVAIQHQTSEIAYLVLSSVVARLEMQSSLDCSFLQLHALTDPSCRGLTFQFR